MCKNNQLILKFLVLVYFQYRPDHPHSNPFKLPSKSPDVFYNLTLSLLNIDHISESTFPLLSFTLNQGLTSLFIVYFIYSLD